MTFFELWQKLDKLWKTFHYGNYQFPATARFDFPIFGKAEKYRIVSIDKDGTLVLYNPTCDRPAGH